MIGDRNCSGVEAEYESANNDVAHDSVDRRTVNDDSRYTSVVPKLPVLLSVAISRIIESVGVRAPGEDGLIGGIGRLIGVENDFMGGETVLTAFRNGPATAEKDLMNGANGHADRANGHTDGENARADDENGRVNSESDPVKGENGGTGDETPRHGGVVIVVEGLNVERWSEVDEATKPNVHGFAASLRHRYACG